MPTTKKLTAIRDPYTKAKLLSAIAEDTGLPKKDVAAVFDSLSDYTHRHLKKRSCGTFTLPGLARFSVVSKKATRARRGINPFTGEETTFAAKPARRLVKIRALKGVKDMAAS